MVVPNFELLLIYCTYLLSSDINHPPVFLPPNTNLFESNLLVIVNNEVIFIETSRREILLFDFMPRAFVSPRASNAVPNQMVEPLFPYDDDGWPDVSDSEERGCYCISDGSASVTHSGSGLRHMWVAHRSSHAAETSIFPRK